MCADSGALSCLCIGAERAFSWSMGCSCISNKASHYIRLTSTSSPSRDAASNNSCSLFSHRLRREGQPGAITRSGGAPAFQPLGLALCRNALPPMGAARTVGSQRCASSLRLRATRPWLPPARRQGACFPLSRLCTYVRRDSGRVDPREPRHRPVSPSLRGVALPRGWGLDTAAKWKTRGEEETRENPYKDEKKRVGGFVRVQMRLNAMGIHQFPQDSPLFLCHKTQRQEADTTLRDLLPFFFFFFSLSVVLAASVCSPLKMVAQFGGARFISRRCIIITGGPEGVEQEQIVGSPLLSFCEMLKWKSSPRKKGKSSVFGVVLCMRSCLCLIAWKNSRL